MLAEYGKLKSNDSNETLFANALDREIERERGHPRASGTVWLPPNGKQGNKRFRLSMENLFHFDLQQWQKVFAVC